MKEFVERLIDSIEKRKEIILSHDIIDAEDEAMVFAYNETINIIKFFAEKYKDGWIPCSERLPEENTEVIVTVREIEDSRYTQTSWMQEGQWVVKKTPLMPEVIAWQPLPESYKEGSEVKEYTHPNGYSAKLYGETSLSIFFEGKEVLHTGFRNVNTEEEVMKLLENYPEATYFLKTFARPNILQANSNFVVVDPAEELLRDYGKYSSRIKTINLTKMPKSSKYTPEERR